MKSIFSTFLLLCQIAAGALQFESTFIEVHADANASKASVDFAFTNSGQQPIKISHVDPDCSCIAIKIKGGKLTYKPGETGVIRANFDIGNSRGTVDQVVAVWLAGDPKDKPSISLKARIHIPVLVSIEPKSLKWELGADTSQKAIQVSMNHSQPIHITRVSCSSKDFAVELKTVEDGASYEVVVTPVAVTRPSMAVIKIETDCTVAKQQNQQAFAMVLKAKSKDGQP